MNSHRTPSFRLICITASLVMLLGLAMVRDAGATEPVTIAAPERPPVIVAPAALEDQVKYAVDDLRHYLRKITDLNVELAPNGAAGKFGIYVGEVPANDDLKAIIQREQLGRDGFVLDVGPSGVRILGGSKFGTAAPARPT